MLVLLVLAIRVDAAPASDPIAEAVRYADILTGADLDAQIARRAPDDPDDQLADAASEDDDGDGDGDGDGDDDDDEDDDGDGDGHGHASKRDSERTEQDDPRGAPDLANDARDNTARKDAPRSEPARADAPRSKADRADGKRGKVDRSVAPRGEPARADDAGDKPARGDTPRNKPDRADDQRGKPARGDDSRNKPDRADDKRGKRDREHDPRSRRHRANAARDGDPADGSTQARETIATAERAAPASSEDEPALDFAVAEHAGELALLDDAAIGSGADTSDDAGLASASAGATETYEARMRSQRSWLVGRLDVGLSWRRRETAPMHAPARLDHQLWLFATWRR
ncbi:MAG: hypothetical protein H7138_02460 [Myxococcales bacterium]|nr:hypothetical protein [Myxococcales bacterium]